MHVVMKVWRTTSGIQLHNYWEMYKTARQTATAHSALHETAVCFTSPYTRRYAANAHRPPLYPSLHTLEWTHVASRADAEFSLRPWRSPHPTSFRCFIPKNHAENTVTADCCTQNCSRSNTNYTHKAAQLQRIKVNVIEVGAPANGRRQRRKRRANCS